MEAAGVLDERYDEVDDTVRARRVPSMQLAGSPERSWSGSRKVPGQVSPPAAAARSGGG